MIPSNDISIDNCLVCSKPRQHRLPFLEIYTRSKHPFDFLYIDAWGTYKHSTYDGHKYFFTIVDDHTQYIWTHLMSSKSSAFTLIKDFVSLIKAQFQTIIKVIRTNNAY